MSDSNQSIPTTFQSGKSYSTAVKFIFKNVVNLFGKFRREDVSTMQYDETGSLLILIFESLK